MSDPVNHPSHYNKHPSGIECLDVVEHFNFNLGNALKYIWRCDLKRDDIEDLKKAEFYIKREIEKRLKEEIIKTRAVLSNVENKKDTYADAAAAIRERMFPGSR